MSIRSVALRTAARCVAPGATRAVTSRRALHSEPIPGELAEYSVVYHDRTHNHMSPTFLGSMQDLVGNLKEAYGAASVAVIPGSGTYGMESAARQFAGGEHVVVVRNGWFSYRWTQIFEEGGFAKSHTVLKAQPTDLDPKKCGRDCQCQTTCLQPSYAPPAAADVAATIRKEKPGLVCVPHVETSAGIIVPDAWIKEVAAATHEVGGLFLLDAIAGGCAFVDMPGLGVDVLLSAPQKGLAGPACAGLVMMSEAARKAVDERKSSSFAIGLKPWTAWTENAEKGVATYHTTPPTDALMDASVGLKNIKQMGWAEAKSMQLSLGSKMRDMFKEKGYKSVAADGFGAPGILVNYCKPGVEKMAMVGAFKKQGIQIAAGVPLEIDEVQPFNTFRLGFFGVDKLKNQDQYVQRLGEALDKVAA